MDDEYIHYAVIVKTQNGTVISEDRIWRTNGKIYVLDDPSTEYLFIYSYAILIPTYVPDDGTTFDTAKPSITITYNESVEITAATFDSIDILDQLTTTDNMTFIFTSA